MYRFPLSFLSLLVVLATQAVGSSTKTLAQSDSIQQGLIQAGKNCDRELASILISQGANPNLSPEGTQPIKIAIEEFNYTFTFSKEEYRQQCLDFINYLLENQADPNLLFVPPDGRFDEFDDVAPSPLFKAVEVPSGINFGLKTVSNTQVIEALLSNGANPNIRSLTEYKNLAVNSTPLMALMEKSTNSYDNVRQVWDVLLPVSDVNLQNNDGQTALMILVEGSVGENEVKVQRLLDAGARTDIKDAGGKTALDIAISQGKTDIVKLLSQ